MRILNSVALVVWLLAHLQFVTSHSPLPKLPSIGVRLSANAARFGLSKLPRKSNAPTPEVAPLPVEQPATRHGALKMVAEAVFECFFATELTSLLATASSIEPSRILVGVNLCVHAAWQLANPQKRQNLFRFMRRHFVLKSNDLKNQRVHTILLSGFSHRARDHLASNMSALLLLGPKLSKLLGNRLYSYFYFTSIYAGDLYNQLFYNSKNIKTRFLVWQFDIPSASLGASGAVSALLCYYCLQYPLDGK